MGPGGLLVVAAVGVLVATPFIERMDGFAAGIFQGGPDTPSYGWAMTRWLAMCLLAFGPAVLFIGMVLPWCLEEFRDPVRCGRLYAANTLGAITGSVLAAWVLLPGVGFAPTAWIIAILLLATALALQSRRGKLLALAAGSAALGVGVVWNTGVGQQRIMGYGLAGHRLIAHDEGPDSTAGVVEDASGLRFLIIDGYKASSQGGFANYMEWMGRLPMLAHPDPQQALVICFGTGRTANAVREEGPTHLDVAEISPAVLGMAHHFEMNRGVLEDPRVRAIAMDGRAWLRRSDRRYDVITLEPMPPHFAGVNALYSRDFYEIAAERLEPGGILAQWLPLHLLPPHHAASVAASFHAVLPDAVVWIEPRTNTGILMGRRAADATPLGSEWPGLSRQRPHRPAHTERVPDFVVLTPQALALYASSGRVITDDNQGLAYSMLRQELYMGLAARNLRLIADVASRLPRRGSQPGPAPPSYVTATAPPPQARHLRTRIGGWILRAHPEGRSPCWPRWASSRCSPPARVTATPGPIPGPPRTTTRSVCGAIRATAAPANPKRQAAGRAARDLRRAPAL